VPHPSRTLRRVGGHESHSLFRFRLQLKHPQELFDSHLVVCGDVLQDAGECACFDRMMIGNDFVVLAVALCSDPNVRSLLPGCLIAQDAQRLDQSRAVNIAWQSHQARTSSRTK
jgi:hypothetical protein